MSFEIAQKLIQFESVTPAGQDIFIYVQELVKQHLFVSELMPFQSPGQPITQNLFARYGNRGPHLCFVGHLDVVPAGPIEQWTYPPFEALVHDDVLYGRGAVDMKGAVAAFLVAAFKLIKEKKIAGSLSLFLTADEEGEAIDGTVKAFARLKELGHIPDVCLIGEPTSEQRVGDTLKVGRRGSLSGVVEVKGKQGHVAYPHKAYNPIPELNEFLVALASIEWDQGNAHFDPSNLEIITVDVGNNVSNMIPGLANARFNIRYNDLHNREALIDRIDALASIHLKDYTLSFNQGFEPFFTHAPELVKRIQKAVEKATGEPAKISTTGGTSDGRFIHQYCPVLEMGLRNQTAHQIDENVSLQDLKTLEKIYIQILQNFYENG